jgi:hypothetical protein
VILLLVGLMKLFVIIFVVEKNVVVVAYVLNVVVKK